MISVERVGVGGEGPNIFPRGLQVTSHRVKSNGVVDKLVMPRILPRLLKALQESKLRSPTQPAFILPGLARRRNRKKSLWQPLPSEYSLSPHGRTQSILLDEFNPVAHCAAFVAHKTLPPKVHLDEAVQKTRIADGEEREDRPRSMTQEERGWWANPYRTYPAASALCP